VQGCLQCASSQQPSEELCDDIDNDCDCEHDEEQPTRMGAAPPQWAADLVDLSAPQTLASGEQAGAWAAFRNVGQRTWLPHEVWLALAHDAELQPSALRPDEGWPAWDVAAVLERRVAPGEVGFFVFDVQAGAAPGADLRTRLRLIDSGGTELRCPAPDAPLRVSVTLPLATAAAGAEPAAGSPSEDAAPTSPRPEPGASADPPAPPVPGDEPTGSSGDAVGCRLVRVRRPAAPWERPAAWLLRGRRRR